jgi:hypothetical protein
VSKIVFIKHVIACIFKRISVEMVKELTNFFFEILDRSSIDEKCEF